MGASGRWQNGYVLCGNTCEGDFPTSACGMCGADKKKFQLKVGDDSPAKAGELSVGTVLYGTVSRIHVFFAFVELAPGVGGMVHISKLSHKRVESIEDFCRVGDTLKVVVTEIDEKGRIYLSVKDAEGLEVTEETICGEMKKMSVWWRCFECGAAIEGSIPPKTCEICGTGSEYFYAAGDSLPRKKAVMYACGSEKIKVIKALREFMGLGLAEAKDFVEHCPREFQANDSQVALLQVLGAELSAGDTELNDATSHALVFCEPPHKEVLTATHCKSASTQWTKLPEGHTQAVGILSALCQSSDAFLKKLVETKDTWDRSKARSQEIYASVAADIKKRWEDEHKKYTSECNDAVAATRARGQITTRVVDACDTFIGGLPGKAEEAIVAARVEMETVREGKSEVIKAIEAKVQAYKNLCSFQVAESERVRNEQLDKAREELLERETQSEHEFEAKRKSVCDSGCKDIEKVFGKGSIQAYRQGIKSSRFNAENYECPHTVPEYIMLGEIGLTISNRSQDDMSVVQAVELQAEDLGTKSGDEYIVKIPYAQRLEDGISLLMRYSSADRSYVQGMIQPLLLKLFMSFPAGKLEATMIDPLELGASFSDVPKLAEGPNSARIIDTKIWSKERDIENAIATLRQRLENMTQAYGGDQNSRLKKEVIRALAITDFPVGFSEAALKDLHAIVRNSASLGVCVLICANDEELEKLKQRHGTLVAEIAQSMVETEASGKRFVLSEVMSGRLFLQLDEMSDVMERKDKILPLLCDAIEHAQLKVERFDSMYKDDVYDSNNWFGGNHDEVAIPLGIKGANTVVKMVLGRGGGSTEHHALIAGQTGAGKSTLLHTLIMSTLTNYSPDEVQMYLLDFKEGVEFSAYTRYRLPSLRVVAINSEREFGLSVLKELCVELETRTKHFTRYGVSDINGYVKLADVPKVPKLLLIFDEVQELFRSKGESDSISSECLSCVNKLVMQGRALGIHIILACQDFSNCAGLEAYFSQMAIRIAVKGSEEGAASILSADNAGIKTLQNQPAGAAIYNNGGGVESANSFFQVSYINEKERLNLLARLDTYFTDADVAPLYEEYQTRVLLTNAEDNIHNCFNRLILDGPSSVEPLGVSNDGYGLLLGQSFGKKSIFMPELRMKDRDNMLIVTRDEKMALSLSELSAMSVLYEELHTDADKGNALIYIVDMLAEELTDGECDFDFLESQFPKQVKVAKIGEAENLISSLHEVLLKRAEGTVPAKERIFLLFFGINRARRLCTDGMYSGDENGELSPIGMLQKILSIGPRYGINSILWGESIHGIEFVLGERYASMFDKRIAYGLDEESMDILVAESDVKALRGKTAVYIDISTDVRNTHFRPYDVPAKVWIERYAETYDEIVKEGGC